MAPASKVRGLPRARHVSSIKSINRLIALGLRLMYDAKGLPDLL
jgi:hypothetical protein